MTRIKTTRTPPKRLTQSTTSRETYAKRTTRHAAKHHRKIPPKRLTQSTTSRETNAGRNDGECKHPKVYDEKP